MNDKRIRERAEKRIRVIERNESALVVEMFDGNRWFTISVPPNRQVTELQHDRLVQSFLAFALSERDAATKEATEQACKDVCEWCAGIDKQVGRALKPDGTRTTWTHYGHTRMYECKAAAIRSRVAAQEKP